MKYSIVAVACSAVFACTDQPDPTSDAQQETVETQSPLPDDEVVEAGPPDDVDGSGASRPRLEQWDEGDDTHWYTPIWPFPWPWHHGHKMDPEPDRRKNKRACYDWCAWDARQCEKECWHLYPDPKRDIGHRNFCLDQCKKKFRDCELDCQKRFPGRPIITVAP